MKIRAYYKAKFDYDEKGNVKMITGKEQTVYIIATRPNGYADIVCPVEQDESKLKTVRFSELRIVDPEYLTWFDVPQPLWKDRQPKYDIVRDDERFKATEKVEQKAMHVKEYKEGYSHLAKKQN